MNGSFDKYPGIIDKGTGVFDDTLPSKWLLTLFLLIMECCPDEWLYLADGRKTRGIPPIYNVFNRVFGR